MGETSKSPLILCLFGSFFCALSKSSKNPLFFARLLHTINDHNKVKSIRLVSFENVI